MSMTRVGSTLSLTLLSLIVAGGFERAVHARPSFDGAGGTGVVSIAPASREAGAVDRPHRLLQDEPDPDAEPTLYDDGVVHEVALTFEQEDWVAALRCPARAGPGRPGGGGATPEPPTDVPARLEIDGHVIERVGVRCKGNSSTGINGPKKPLNLTIDSFDDGQRLWGFDVINFNNNYNDPTQMREAIILSMLGEFMAVPRHGWAQVTVHGEVVGLYLMVEQLDRTFSEDWFGDVGLMIRGDSPVRIAFNSSTLNWQGEDLAPYRAGYEVKGPGGDADAGYELVRELTRALDAPVSEGGLSDEDFNEGIWQILDVDSVLWYLAGHNITADYDSYYVGKNYYLHHGERDPRHHMVSWDMGLGFGVFAYMPAGGFGPGFPGGPGGGGTPVEEVDPFAQDDAASRPLIRRLLAVPEFRADYVAHYRALRESLFTEAWVDSLGTRYQELIRSSVETEAAAHGRIAGAFSVAQWEQNLRSSVQVQGFRGNTTVPGIVSLVRERGAFIDAHAAMQPPDVALEERAVLPAEPTLADEVTLVARFAGGDAVTAAQLRYRVRGGIEQRVPMTRDGDGRWKAVVPPQPVGRVVTYAYRAEIEDGRAVFFPAANWTAPYRYTVAGVMLPRVATGDLVLNELLADNEAALADEVGEFDDWLELYNRGVAPIDLGDFFLSDDPSDPWAFALPAQSLGPGERLLVWCDNDEEQGPLHAPFRLSKDGESVVLTTQDAIHDQVDFAEQATDVSFGRMTDGADSWAQCASPSPGAANACTGYDAPPEPTAEPLPTPTAEPGGAEAGSKLYLPRAVRD